jgi:methylated-DNA-[protein]-cysteine S-methyltransferase
MTSLVAGEPIDLTGVQIDLSKAPSFHQRVYEITRAIPPGHTRTYGEIASELGDLSASRAVGQALGRNPVPLIVPCHRVLAAAGRSGGFSANGGVALKHELLAIEGALPREGTLDF